MADVSTDEGTRTSKRGSCSRSTFCRKLVYAAVASCFACENAYANPTGPAVVNGQVSISSQGNVLNVTNSPGAIINWQKFSIGASETTRFIQQNSASSVLNRVVGQDPSVLLGTLQSNGRVFLINPTGILVGQGARIDVGSLVASTLNITDQNFLANKLNFGGPGATAVPGAVQNFGAITTPEGGSVYLVAPNVENHGIITSPKGEVLLAAGNSVKLIDTGTPNVYVEITAPDNQALNLGRIVAQSGRIGISAGLVNQKGVVNADSAVLGENGKIIFKATKGVTLDKGSVTTANGPTGGAIKIQSESGATMVSGKVEATGSAAEGGTIELLGDQVGLIDQAQVSTSGRTGGGTVLIGGDYQGSNPDIQNAAAAYVGSEVQISADAIESGAGGKVIVWADESTRFYGSISARGGAQSGDGGLVETSGKQWLDFRGAVDTSAPHGAMGTLLLDPKNLDANDSGGSAYANPGNALFTDNPSGTSIVLASGPGSISEQTSNVLLNVNNDLTFTSPVNITHAGTTLTAQAGRSILVNANITTNNADVRLTANETTANGVNGSNRDAGAASLSMATGTTINAGTGNIFLRMNDGSGHAGTSGNIVVENLSANNVSILHDGLTSGSSILRNSASSLITGAGAVFMELESASGATASIGTSSAPIRVSTPVLEAHSHNATGGIFIDSPNHANMQIGGVPSSIFSGSVRGVQTVSGGPVQISVNGDLSQLAGSAGCGSTGGTGGPICAGTGGSINLTTSNSDITLNSDVLAADAITIQSSGNLTQNAGTISNAAGHMTAGSNDVRLSGVDVALGTVASQRDLFITASGSLTVGNVRTFGAQNFHFDDNFFSYSLPFTFSFYGTPYNTAFINSNGSITFGSGTSSFSDSTSALASHRMVAPAWNDWETRSSARDIYISNAAGGLTVRWDVERWPTTGRLAQFEALLGTSGNITFNYGPANNSFSGDVTIGLANQSTASRIVSQLMSQSPFSLDRLNSTVFSYNSGTGTYTEAVSTSSNWSTAVAGGGGPTAAGALSALRNATLGAGTTIALNGSLTASNNLAFAAGGQVLLSDATVSAGAAVNVGSSAAPVGSFDVISTDTAASLSAGTSFTANVTDDVTVQGGGASAEIMNTGPATFSITSGGNVSVTGGSGETAYARIFGNPDVNLTVGGNINLTSGDGGSGAFARIQAGSPDSIIVSFTSPTGQILVNDSPFVPGAGGDSGLFVGPRTSATPTPAPASSLQVSFAAPASSTQAADQAVQAVSNTSIQATTTASDAATQTTGTPTDTLTTPTSDAEEREDRQQDQKQASGESSASKAPKPKPQLCN